MSHVAVGLIDREADGDVSLLAACRIQARLQVPDDRLLDRQAGAQRGRLQTFLLVCSEPQSEPHQGCVARSATGCRQTA